MTIPRPLVALALIAASFYVSSKAWKSFAPTSRMHGFVRGLLTLVAGCALLYAADLAYFDPRYGGLAGYATEGWLAGSEAESLDGEIGSIQSALSIYYGDHEGKYPETLDLLWKDGKYLQRPPRRADVYAEIPGRGIARPHWYRESDKIKIFPSLAASDDTGGWGYVNDLHSPDYGAVFVNCTHINFRKGIPWNQMRQPVRAAPAAQAENSPAVVPGANAVPPAAPLPAPREGFRGWVLALGVPVSGAELAFESVDGAPTVKATSGADGRYEIDLPVGRYHVTVTAAKYQPYSTGKGFFVVLPGVRGTGNILMRPL
jgi:hypothetical protein